MEISSVTIQRGYSVIRRSTSHFYYFLLFPSISYCVLRVTRTVTAGKIYVEVERARLTHQLALLKEVDGDVEAAATAMQEMPVETFGSMEKKEKVFFTKGRRTVLFKNSNVAATCGSWISRLGDAYE